MRVRFTELPQGTGGVYDHLRGEIRLSPKLHGILLFHTLLHEFGHWLVDKLLPPSEDERDYGRETRFGRGLVREILNDWIHRLDRWSGNKAVERLLLKLADKTITLDEIFTLLAYHGLTKREVPLNRETVG